MSGFDTPVVRAPLTSGGLTMERLFAGLAAACLLQVATMAVAAGDGDAKAGLDYAQHYCSSCHGIGGEQSPLAEAPPFHDVANQPGMTQTALQAWLQTSHPTMPNIVVAPADMQNVIAYILSLKGNI
jgi:mono/diheme cytochrome c family protein